RQQSELGEVGPSGLCLATLSPRSTVANIGPRACTGVPLTKMLGDRLASWHPLSPQASLATVPSPIEETPGRPKGSYYCPHLYVTKTGLLACLSLHDALPISGSSPNLARLGLRGYA